MKKSPMTTGEQKNLEEEMNRKSKEIRILKAQLSAVQEENKNLKGGILGMSLDLSRGLI